MAKNENKLTTIKENDDDGSDRGMWSECWIDETGLCIELTCYDKSMLVNDGDLLGSGLI
jgi:hypothetical protein